MQVRHSVALWVNLPIIFRNKEISKIIILPMVARLVRWLVFILHYVCKSKQVVSFNSFNSSCWFYYLIRLEIAVLRDFQTRSVEVLEYIVYFRADAFDWLSYIEVKSIFIEGIETVSVLTFLTLILLICHYFFLFIIFRQKVN